MALPPTPNPILAVTLPIVLDKPPGTHAPTEALRLALLGVGAVHMAYLTSRRRVCVGVGGVDAHGSVGTGGVPVVSGMDADPELAGGESDAARMMGLSSMLRLGATRCLAVACRNPEETRSDAALGATMAVTVIDVSPIIHNHCFTLFNFVVRSFREVINGLETSIWRKLLLHSGADLLPFLIPVYLNRQDLVVE